MVESLHSLGLPEGLVDAPALSTAAVVAFTEGPAVDAEGNVCYLLHLTPLPGLTVAKYRK